MSDIAGVRPFRPGDEAALARICVATADAGGDASGLLDDDDIWPALFLLPYLERHRDLSFVLESSGGQPLGYVVGTDDTAAFERWFREEWWPRFRMRWPAPATIASRQDGMVAYGYTLGSAPSQPFEDFPAHLHIDLDAEARGGGWGKALVEELCAALVSRGVPGVHAAAAGANTGARAFYPRVGFGRIASDERSETFGRRLR